MEREMTDDEIKKIIMESETTEDEIYNKIIKVMQLKSRELNAIPTKVPKKIVMYILPVLTVLINYHLGVLIQPWILHSDTQF